MKTAKTSTENLQPVVTESDQLLYYDKLNFIPVEQKDKQWAAKWIYFAKTHAVPFLDPSKAFEVRDKMQGNIDEAAHKKMIDPTLGKAEFFHADFKGLPIDNHLDEIVETTIKQIPVNLSVKAVDQYSISNKEANSRRILKRDLVSNIINQINADLGFPLLKKGEDPFKYIDQMRSQSQPAAAGQPAGLPAPAVPGTTGRKQMMPADMVQSFISQIDSSYLMGVYNQFLHKEGVEIACELGIDYYLNVKNKFVFNHATNLLQDIKAFNKAACRMFTSQTTGTPIFEYYRPDDVHISQYSKRDISDHTFWFVEKECTFSDFMRMFGAECSETQLIEIFELNRKYNNVSQKTYQECTVFQRNNAIVKYGYMEFESQDMEVYADYMIMGNAAYKKQASDFVPGFKKNEKGDLVKNANIQNSVRDEAHYNVWYKCYFIPAYIFSTTTGTTDFVEQAKYIYQFGKLQDQERYGDDERFARSSLVGFYSDRMTWFEIKDRFMGKIHHLWFLFQNDLANIMPHGLNWAYEAIVLMAKNADGVNTNTAAALSEWTRKVKETGSAITKALKDKDGNPIGNSQPFQEIKTSHLESALGKLDAIMILYNMMVKALGQNELSEGDAPKPRTNLGSIQIALGTSGKATFYVEEAFTDILSCIGNKILKYFKDIVDLGDSRRLQEFTDLVGQANMAALKEIKGIPLRNLGLYVENTMTKDQKDMVIQMAQSMASAGTLDMATALYLTFVDNLKEAYAILIFQKAQMDKQLAEAEQAKQDFQLSLLDKQLQLELAKISAAGQQKIQLEQVIGKIQTQLEEVVINLKGHWTMAGKEQIKQNRIEQDITSSQIDKLNGPGSEDALPERKNMPVAS